MQVTIKFNLFTFAGIAFILLLAGIVIGSVGRLHPAYVVDVRMVVTCLIMTGVPFLLGYAGGISDDDAP